MPLDADRIAAALLEGCKALIAKEVTPLRAENDALRARLAAVEAREFPAVPPDTAGAVAALAGRVEAVEAKAEAADLAIAAVQSAVEEPVDLSGFATKAEVDAMRSEIPTLPDAPDLSGFATKADVESLRGDFPALPEPPDLSGFATKAEVAEVRDAIPAIPPVPDVDAILADAAAKAVEITKAALADLPEPKDYGPEIEAVKAAIPELPPAPDLSGLATKAEVAEAVAAIQLPEPVAGKDGRGIADVKVNGDREVLVKFTDGETKNLGSFDGLGFDDLSVEDGEREFTVVFARGDQVKRFPLAKDVVIDRGIWKEGSGYVRGDGLTYAGDYWIAQEPTTSRPGTDKTWRLAVRKGRDAKPVTR